ncbi:MAG: type II secretion system F family protein, partial [Actinomycetia bacterium]|nr:type II secretion system F family protein [Actinomycetes bacterium]
MARFDYKAKNKAGEIISGSMDASSESMLVSKLKEQGLMVLDIKNYRDKSTQRLTRDIALFDRIKMRDVVVFTRQFSTLISSGMSLIESLVILEKQAESDKFHKIISAVRRDIESGHSLSEAMAKHKIFNRLYISLIRAGETGGVLDESMVNLADFLEKDEKIKMQIKSKTAYPKFVLGFAVIITLVIIMFLVPTFQEIYDDLGVQLPAMTRAVIWVGDIFKSIYFYVFLIVAGVGGRFLFRRYSRTPGGRKTIDTIRIKIPKMGPVIKKMALARFAKYLGTLMIAGVPILSALDIVRGVTDNML